MNARDYATSLLLQAGLNVNGGDPADIQIHDERLYGRLITQGSLGLGESYMEGWWDCEHLEEFFKKVLTAGLNRRRPGWGVVLGRAQHYLANLQSIARSTRVADAHYNVSNEMFRSMLGETLAYSCAYWKEATDLDAAQIAKYDLICRKLQLDDTHHVLDVGCGWGGFAHYVAKRYGCQVTGVTVADEQAAFARELCHGQNVQILCCDYRQIPRQLAGQRFTRIVSIGMYEHVGYRNYRTFAEIMQQMLEGSGLFLLHTIGGHRTTRYTTDPWFAKYIFPGGMFPSLQQIGRSIEQLFVIEDLQNIGFDYSRTLQAWRERFERFWEDPAQRRNRPSIRGSEDMFYRMWRYYLSSASANFRIRGISVWQLVLSKNGVPGGYISPR